MYILVATVSKLKVEIMIKDGDGDHVKFAKAAKTATNTDWSTDVETEIHRRHLDFHI
jgi:hypothetical protein